MVLLTRNHRVVFDCFRMKLNSLIVEWGSGGDRKLRRNLYPFRQIRVPFRFTLPLLFRMLREEFGWYESSQYLLSGRYGIFSAYVFDYRVREFFRKNRPAGVLLFNDHVPAAISIRMAAQAKRIPTIYVPHASVSTRFPPLKFDYALLEGEDMREKYRQCGTIESKVFLVGNVKFDEVQTQEGERNSKILIGIGYNDLDNLVKVEDFIDNLKSLLDTQFGLGNYGIVLRPHPALNKRVGLSDSSVSESDPLVESSIQFLQRLHVLLSGNSNLILEGLLMGVPTHYFELEPSPVADNYGFVKRGLIDPPFTTAEEAVRRIEESRRREWKISDRQREMLAEYNGAIGSEWEGKVGDRIAEIVDAIVDGKEAKYLSRDEAAGEVSVESHEPVVSRV